MPQPFCAVCAICERALLPEPQSHLPRKKNHTKNVNNIKIKEVELLNSLSYDDIVEYVKNKHITESKDNVIKDLDLTY